MINRLWEWYVLINYCGQRTTGSFFMEKSVINTIMFEISFAISGILFGIIKMIGIRNPWIGAILAFGYVLIIWKMFEPKVKNKINFKELEKRYLSMRKEMRVFSLFATILLLGITFFLMFFYIILIFSNSI